MTHPGLRALCALVLPAVAVRGLNVGVIGPMDIDGVNVLYAAALLAAEHFNARNASITNAFEGLDGCATRFNATLVDSRGSVRTAIDHFVDGVQRQGWRAAVGAGYSSISGPLALLGSLFDVPLVSPASRAEDLDDRDKYPYFARSTASVSSTAYAMVRYISTLGWARLGIVAVADQFGRSFAAELLTLCAGVGIEVVATVYYTQLDDESIGSALGVLAAGGERAPRVIISINTAGQESRVITAAHAAGLVSSAHHWLISSGLTEVDPDSEAARLLDGAVQIVGVGGRDGDPRWEALRAELSARSWAEYAHLVPHEADRLHLPSWPYTVTHRAAFGYDAMALVARAVCLAGEEATAAELYAALTATPSIVGATGTVELSASGTRTPASSAFVCHNLVYRPDSGLGEVRRQVGVFAADAWVFGEDTPLVFAGGATTPPSDGTDVPRAEGGGGGGGGGDGDGGGDGGGTVTVEAAAGEGGLLVLVLVLCLSLLSVLILVLLVCALRFRRRVHQLEVGAERPEPVPVLIISDAGEDLDDEMALLMGKFLQDEGLLELRGVVANLTPPEPRARLVRGTLDVLGLTKVPVGIGTDGGSRTHEANFLETAESYMPPAQSQRARSLEPGRALMHRVLVEAAPASLTLLCISSLKDAALFMRDNQALCAAKLRRVVVMGGLDLEASRRVSGLVPDSAHNNMFHAEAARLLLRLCTELRIGTTVVSRFAAYAAPVSREVYDHLAQSGSPVGWRLRKVQRDSIEGLWRRACAAPGSDARRGLPERCDRAWFSTTFCGGGADSRSASDPIWDVVKAFNLYDVVAILACVPVLSAHLFMPLDLGAEIGPAFARHELIGRSAAQPGLHDASDVRIVMERGISRVFGLGQHAAGAWRQPVVLLIDAARDDPASAPALLALRSLLEVKAVMCAGVIVVSSAEGPRGLGRRDGGAVLPPIGHRHSPHSLEDSEQAADAAAARVSRAQRRAAQLRELLDALSLGDVDVHWLVPRGELGPTSPGLARTPSQPPTPSLPERAMLGRARKKRHASEPLVPAAGGVPGGSEGAAEAGSGTPVVTDDDVVGALARTFRRLPPSGSRLVLPSGAAPALAEFAHACPLLFRERIAEVLAPGEWTAEAGASSGSFRRAGGSSFKAAAAPREPAAPAAGPLGRAALGLPHWPPPAAGGGGASPALAASAAGEPQRSRGSADEGGGAAEGGAAMAAELPLELSVPPACARLRADEEEGPAGAPSHAANHAPLRLSANQALAFQCGRLGVPLVLLPGSISRSAAVPRSVLDELPHVGGTLGTRVLESVRAPVEALAAPAAAAKGGAAAPAAGGGCARVQLPDAASAFGHEYGGAAASACAAGESEEHGGAWARVRSVPLSGPMLLLAAARRDHFFAPPQPSNSVIVRGARHSVLSLRAEHGSGSAASAQQLAAAAAQLLLKAASLDSADALHSHATSAVAAPSTPSKQPLPLRRWSSRPADVAGGPAAPVHTAPAPPGSGAVAAEAAVVRAAVVVCEGVGPISLADEVPDWLTSTPAQPGQGALALPPPSGGQSDSPFGAHRSTSGGGGGAHPQREQPGSALEQLGGDDDRSDAASSISPQDEARFELDSVEYARLDQILEHVSGARAASVRSRSQQSSRRASPATLPARFSPSAMPRQPSSEHSSHRSSPAAPGRPLSAEADETGGTGITRAWSPTRSAAHRGRLDPIPASTRASHCSVAHDSQSRHHPFVSPLSDHSSSRRHAPFAARASPQ